jgi:Tfp pilus assembly protein PilN
MIKINLSIEKQQFDPSNVAGLDFTRIKVMPLLGAIIFYNLPDFTLMSFWEKEREVANQSVTQKQGELSEIKRSLSKSMDLNKQISELKAQEENLGKKLNAVKEAIKEKRNPASLLLYISKNIPNELWIKNLEIKDLQLLIKGESLDYASIGNFVNSLRSSIFIKEATIVGTSSTVRESDKKRVELFEVKFTIARFDQ